VKICKKYSDESVDTVKRQPYRLAADIWGLRGRPVLYHLMCKHELVAGLREELHGPGSTVQAGVVPR
jgi:hypothetical protein